MVILYPYVNAHPLAKAALRKYIPDATPVRLDTTSDAYWRLLCDYWNGGEDLCIVEQDIEVHSMVARRFRHCSEPWCEFAYNGPQFGQSGKWELSRGLGCVRFTQALMAEYPTLVKDLKNCTWRRLDVEISGALVGNPNDPRHLPHAHRPNVLHHHVYQGRCACEMDHEPYTIDGEGRYKEPDAE